MKKTLSVFCFKEQVAIAGAFTDNFKNLAWLIRFE